MREKNEKGGGRKRRGGGGGWWLNKSPGIKVGIFNLQEKIPFTLSNNKYKIYKISWFIIDFKNLEIKRLNNMDSNNIRIFIFFEFIRK
jgi:hypothetical protein